MWPNAMLDWEGGGGLVFFWRGEGIDARVGGEGRGRGRYVLARTPNWGPHSLAITLVKPVTPALAMP